MEDAVEFGPKREGHRRWPYLVLAVVLVAVGVLALRQYTYVASVATLEKISEPSFSERSEGEVYSATVAAVAEKRPTVEASLEEQRPYVSHLIDLGEETAPKLTEEQFAHLGSGSPDALFTSVYTPAAAVVCEAYEKRVWMPGFKGSVERKCERMATYERLSLTQLTVLMLATAYKNKCYLSYGDRILWPSAQNSAEEERLGESVFAPLIPQTLRSTPKGEEEWELSQAMEEQLHAHATEANCFEDYPELQGRLPAPQA